MLFNGPVGVMTCTTVISPKPECVEDKWRWQRDFQASKSFIHHNRHPYSFNRLPTISNMMSIASLYKSFLFLGIALLATGPATNAQSAAAQAFEKLPACAKLCVITAYSSLNNACAQTDAACFCKNTGFVTSSDSCYASSCTGSDLTAARAWGLSSCAQAGVTLPPTNGAAQNSSSGSSTPAPSSGSSASSGSSPVQGAKASASSSSAVSSVGLITACAMVGISLNL
ncbi:hypothetical protein KEM48_013764 [Puccinia striiformis f. sp. tritici PST-130]|nr:hypothetical protein KEM48_013764 [Puccinia striiformis f. sp. tritici PST-130]